MFMLEYIGECNHFGKTAIHWCVLLPSQVTLGSDTPCPHQGSWRQWADAVVIPRAYTQKTQPCVFWDRGNCWAFSPWKRGRQPCHHFTDSLTPPSHLPCHHFPKSHLLLWASSACAHTQQRPKLKLNLCGVLAQFPFNQTNSQTLFRGWEQLRHKQRWQRVTYKCPSCKPAPPQEPQPVQVQGSTRHFWSSTLPETNPHTEPKGRNEHTGPKLLVLKAATISFSSPGCSHTCSESWEEAHGIPWAPSPAGKTGETTA